MNASAEAISIELPYMAIAAKRFHNGDEFRILALHGWLDNAASFDFLGPLIENAELIAVDLVGHGKSDHRPNGTVYHYLDYVRDAVAILGALDWQDVVLMGHSLGAGLVGVISAVVPERVRGVVMMDGIGPFIRSPEDATRILRESVTQTLRPPQDNRTYDNLDRLISARVAVTDMNEQTSRPIIERSTVKVSGGYQWSSDPRLKTRSPLYMTELQVQTHLAAIECPVLFLEGETSTVLNPKVVPARMKVIKNLVASTLPGGHHFHMSHPEPVAKSINRFLDNLPGRIQGERDNTRKSG